MSTARLALSLLMLAACGFPRPADVPGDDIPGGGSDGSVDSADAPQLLSVTVQVSTAGDDGNDGLHQPVRTLKRAIAIAQANTEITTIVLGAGRYDTGNGEVFPYTVPANVTLAGPAPGSGMSSAILAGTTAEAALTLDRGSLQDVELDDFAVAITATGQVGLTRLRIVDSLLAVKGEATAKLNATHIDITGSTSMCGSGFQLKGSAALTADTISTHNLQSGVQATESSTVDVKNSDLAGDPRCRGTGLDVSTGQIFRIADSTIVGYGTGIHISGGPVSPTLASIVNVKFLNSEDALSGTSGAIIQMTGGEISGSSTSASGLFGGSLSLVNVSLVNNANFALFVLGGPGVGVATLSMRGCTVTGNKGGVSLFDMSAGDLGTDASPGLNTFQNNQTVGVSVQGTMGPLLVDAVGNTWNPNIQNADATGRYPNVLTVGGPVTSVARNNFDIASGLSLRR